MYNPNNPHLKPGIPVQFHKSELLKLHQDENFQMLMNWTENNLRLCTILISDNFFGGYFTKRQRELIVSIIYSCYDVVENIEPLGKNGLVITSKGVLTQTELKSN